MFVFRHSSCGTFHMIMNVVVADGCWFVLPLVVLSRCKTNFVQLGDNCIMCNVKIFVCCVNLRFQICFLCGIIRQS